jgi:hypothetical protein
MPSFQIGPQLNSDDQAEVAVIRHRVNQKPLRVSKSASQKTNSQSPASSTASSRRKKATAKQSTVTPKPASLAQNARSTRSTRSQSIMTIDSVSTVDVMPATEQQPQSTPNRTKKLQPTLSSDDEVPGTGGKGKGKSSLRPRPSKYISSSQATNSARSSSAGALQSKKAASLPIPLDAEDAMQIDSPDEQDHDEGIPSTTCTTSDSDSNDDIPNTTAKAATSLNPTKTTLALRPQDLESSNNNNEGDVWYCSIDGCMHKTYAASQPNSQLLIAAHKQTHEFDDDERVQLVRRMEAPYLPVNRLMDRVRGIAAQKGFPPPIVQRY